MAVTATNPNLTNVGCEPTVLVVGEEPRLSELVSALATDGFAVKTCPIDEVVNAVNSTAPDLALLVGPAANTSLIESLGADAAGAVVPLVLLTESATAASGQAFKHGIVGLIDREQRVSEIAQRVREIASELPERPGESDGDIRGEATLDEIVSLLSNELRSGILSLKCRAQGAEEYGARIVLRTGRTVTEGAEAFILRVRPYLDENGANAYRFQEQSSGRVDSVAAPRPSDIDGIPALKRRRILVIGSDRERNESLAQELRAHEALVVAISESGADLERGRNLDPEVIVIESADFAGPCAGIMEAVRDDLRMRWASILIFPSDQRSQTSKGLIDVGPIANKIAKLTKPDRDLLLRAKTEKAFDTRLEIVGPSRTLRALAQAHRNLRVTLRHPRVSIEIDLAEGSIMGARGEKAAELAEALAGTSALAAFMALGSSKVHVEELAATELSNLVSPVDLTLALAAAEALPVAPSILPPPLVLSPGKLILSSFPPPPQVSIRPVGQEVNEAAGALDAASAAANPVAARSANEAKGDWWLGRALPRADAVPTSEEEAKREEALCNQETVKLDNPIGPVPNAAQGVAPGAPAIGGSADGAPFALKGAEKPPVPRPSPPPRIRAVPPPVPTGAQQTPKAEVVERSASSQAAVVAVMVGVGLVAAAAAGAWRYSQPQSLSDAINQIKLLYVSLFSEGEKTVSKSGATADYQGLPGSDSKIKSGQSPSVAASPIATARSAGRVAGGNDQVVQAVGNEVENYSVSQLASAGDQARSAGRLDEAESFYQRALKVQNDHPDALIGMVRLCLIRGEAELALNWAAVLVQQYPERSMSYLLLGDAYALKGDKQSARNAWKGAARLGSRAARQRLR